MSYFVDAVVEFEGQSFSFPAGDGRGFEDGLNYWHGAGDPSSWLSVAIFMEAWRRTKGAPDEVAQELAAKVLGITV